MIGSEFGAGIAAFLWAFREFNKAVESVVLVSTIAQRLGKGVNGPGVKEDVQMDALRKSLEETFIARGMDKARARIAAGVRRSQIGRERECLAFDPAYLNLTSR